MSCCYNQITTKWSTLKGCLTKYWRHCWTGKFVKCQHFLKGTSRTLPQRMMKQTRTFSEYWKKQTGHKGTCRELILKIQSQVPTDQSPIICLHLKNRKFWKNTQLTNQSFLFIYPHKVIMYTNQNLNVIYNQSSSDVSQVFHGRADWGLCGTIHTYILLPPGNSPCIDAPVPGTTKRFK